MSLYILFLLLCEGMVVVLQLVNIHAVFSHSVTILRDLGLGVGGLGVIQSCPPSQFF